MTAVTSTGSGARVHGLQRSFGDRRVLAGVDLEIAPREFVALLGASGSGKSTLLRILASIDREATGDLELPQRRSVVFQDSRLLPWKRVVDNVRIGISADDGRRRAVAALEEVGLSEHLSAWPRTLSGGEAQRVALARAVVREPELLLLDEPFGALDALTRIRMHRLLLELFDRHGPATLLVTHDVDEALLLADRVLVLRDGRLAFDAPVEIPRPRPRDHPHFAELRDRLLKQLGVFDTDLLGPTNLNNETT
ncbi:ABC transporter ATP-binding protein [Conexibacter sp. CPCC 206217]|uniref:ABC transporter ATP-binding protein n=1 Tax=Conexibacter sp. CPCC 206217 TaxID=3064574 RepID=UPI00271DE8AF|nr:ABC transporter ATP-binding protein [Conexibacter sp. CPCC 206217]MDO8212140.1 ABC transporter ATP-binding protein [Conexibacter sp. CPCC 206217]